MPSSSPSWKDRARSQARNCGVLSLMLSTTWFNKTRSQSFHLFWRGQETQRNPLQAVIRSCMV